LFHSAGPVCPEAFMEVKSFLSPIKKLARFFERSRNGWKRKCLEAKLRIKRLSNQKQKLKASRDRWKENVQTLQRELRQVQQELEELKIGG
jgi:septal ring factor EnvC (AmiA/AmiB activator)